jgi:hypothetical protein
MARTLIGNIKGKDGRGVSKIEKTSTTGTADTYTITYTDGTTSTYEVRNSDSVALQRQIVPSASVESSTTASQSYSAGDYVAVSGVLRKVTASIAKGSAISDSNSTATTVTGELAGISAKRIHGFTLGSNETTPVSFTATKSGCILVIFILQGGWLYGGENGSMEITAIAGTTQLFDFPARIISGNLIGRDSIALSAFSGVKAGKIYQIGYTNAALGGGNRRIIVLEI